MHGGKNCPYIHYQYWKSSEVYSDGVASAELEVALVLCGNYGCRIWKQSLLARRESSAAELQGISQASREIGGDFSVFMGEWPKHWLLWLGACHVRSCFGSCDPSRPSFLIWSSSGCLLAWPTFTSVQGCMLELLKVELFFVRALQGVKKPWFVLQLFQRLGFDSRYTAKVVLIFIFSLALTCTRFDLLHCIINA